MTFIFVLLAHELAKCIQRKLNVAYFLWKHKVEYIMNVNLCLLLIDTLYYIVRFIYLFILITCVLGQGPVVYRLTWQLSTGCDGDLPVLYTVGVVCPTLRLNPITSSVQQGFRRTTSTEVKAAKIAVHNDINLKYIKNTLKLKDEIFWLHLYFLFIKSGYLTHEETF